MGKLYLAYGSNLNLQQMKHRCPHSTVYGKATLNNYRLAFHGNEYNAHATIIPAKGHIIPVLIWEVPEEDEKRLDRYEGYPVYYFKKNITATMNKTKQKISAMVYIMDRSCITNLPNPNYVETIAQGYKDCGFDLEFLNKVLEDNIDEVMDRDHVRICPKCKEPYTGHPAISRKDNTTEICPSCGIHEALGSFLDYIDSNAVNA